MYEISNYGRVKSLKQGKEKILKLYAEPKGYVKVILSKEQNGKKIKFRSTRIHRLVAEAFLKNPNNYTEINHIDMNKKNNYYKNLEYCSRKHNMKEAIKKKPQIINHLVEFNKFIRPKKIYQYDLNDNLIGVYSNAVEANKKTGVCARNILQVASKTPFNKKGNFRKKAGGYIWKFE